MDEPLGNGRDTWASLDRGVRRDLPVPAPVHGQPDKASAMYKVGDRLEHIGRRLRGGAATGPGAAADRVGRALERAGEYLEHRQFAEVRGDAEHLIVRRPVMSLAFAAVVGYALGRVLWR